jgi:hypothetical protein
MSDPIPTDTPQSVQINLRDIGLKYIGAIQRIFDLAACTLGSLRCQTERDYDEFSRAARFMPSQQHRLAFDAVRPISEAWLLRQLLSEGLGILVPVLEDARSVSELARWKAGGAADQSQVQKILGPDRQAFLALSLEDKAKFVRERFGISAPNENFLAGYVKLGAALSRGGTVAQDDANEGNELVVRLATVELQSAPVGEGGVQGAVTGRMAEAQKRFAVGEKVEFRKEEALNLFATIAVYITGILGGLQGFVAKTLPNEVQPQG